MNSHVNPAFQGTLAQMAQRFPENQRVMPDPIKQASDRIAELERDNAAKAKTIALREQNIRDLESDLDNFLGLMAMIVDTRALRGTLPGEMVREMLKRLGYDRSDDARED